MFGHDSAHHSTSAHSSAFHPSGHHARTGHDGSAGKAGVKGGKHARAPKPDEVRDDLTELVCILDASGSMYDLTDDTIGGYNSLIARNRTLPGECIVSTVTFDDESRIIHDRVPIAEIGELTRREYQTGGCTALLDAVGGSIKHIAQVQGYMPAGHKAAKVIFAIITDGQENASRKYDYRQVKSLIEGYQGIGWEFLFLGANIDVTAEAAHLGIKESNAAAYAADAKDTSVVYDALSARIGHSRMNRPSCCAAPMASYMDASRAKRAE